MQSPSPGPAVGAVAIWTSCDLPGLGDQVLGRLVEHELLARLPGWRTDLFAPLGWDRPSPADGGVVAEPLGAHSLARIAQLASSATLSVVCPSFPLGLGPDELTRQYGDDRAGAAEPYLSTGLGAQPESGHPVLPFGVRVAEEVPPGLAALAARAPAIAVRDVTSREHLRAAGVNREIAVVPHPGLLVRRFVDVGTLPVREQQLRQLGILPAEGGYVVVVLAEPAAGAPAMRPWDGLADGKALVVLPLGGLGLDQADQPTLPPDLALEDRLAVLAAADAVIATDEHVAAVAAGLGAAWVLVDPSGADRAAAIEFGDARQIVDSWDKVPGAVRAAGKLPPHKHNADAVLAAQLDRFAEIAEQTLRECGGDQHRHAASLAVENTALRAAHQRQRERVLVERQRLVESLADALVERNKAVNELDRLRAENAELAARAAEHERELVAWQQTKLVRWSRPLRQAYGRARGR